MTSLDDNNSLNMNNDSEESRMSIASNNFETEMASTRFESRINTSSETSIERASLEKECNKRLYLDGTWFVPDISKLSSVGQIYGICQICKIQFNKHSVLCESLNSSSNFKTHIKVRCFEVQNLNYII